MRKKLSEIQPGEKIRCPLRGYEYLMVGPCNGGVAVQCKDLNVMRWTDLQAEYEIIPPEPEPKYRPFKDAAEFEPHRDRWLKWKDNEEYLFRVLSYHDSVVWLSAGRDVAKTWDEALLEATFDDGSPFGVLEQ